MASGESEIDEVITTTASDGVIDVTTVTAAGGDTPDRKYVKARRVGEATTPQPSTSSDAAAEPTLRRSARNAKTTRDTRPVTTADLAAAIEQHPHAGADLQPRPISLTPQMTIHLPSRPDHILRPLLERDVYQLLEYHQRRRQDGFFCHG